MCFFTRAGPIFSFACLLLNATPAQSSSFLTPSFPESTSCCVDADWRAVGLRCRRGKGAQRAATMPSHHVASVLLLLQATLTSPAAAAFKKGGPAPPAPSACACRASLHDICMSPSSITPWATVTGYRVTPVLLLLQEMLTSPTALAKLGYFLLEARRYQSSKTKDVIMVSPPNRGMHPRSRPPLRG